MSPYDFEKRCDAMERKVNALDSRVSRLRSEILEEVVKMITVGAIVAAFVWTVNEWLGSTAAAVIAFVCVPVFMGIRAMKKSAS